MPVTTGFSLTSQSPYPDLASIAIRQLIIVLCTTRFGSPELSIRSDFPTVNVNPSQGRSVCSPTELSISRLTYRGNPAFCEADRDGIPEISSRIDTALRSPTTLAFTISKHVHRDGYVGRPNPGRRDNLSRQIFFSFLSNLKFKKSMDKAYKLTWPFTKPLICPGHPRAIFHFPDNPHRR